MQFHGSSASVVFQCVAQPRIRLFAVSFGRLDQAAGKLRTGRRPSGRVIEQSVLFPMTNGADRTLGCVVVDRQVAVLDVAFQFAPVAGQVADGHAQSILRRDLRLRFLYPVFQLNQQWQAVLHAGNLTIFVASPSSRVRRHRAYWSGSMRC